MKKCVDKALNKKVLQNKYKMLYFIEYNINVLTNINYCL